MSGHAGVHLTVDPGPASLHPWYRSAEQCLGPRPQMIVPGADLELTVGVLTSARYSSV